MDKPVVFTETQMTKETAIKIRVLPSELREIANFLESEMPGQRCGQILPHVLLAILDVGNEIGTEVYLYHRQE